MTQFYMQGPADTMSRARERAFILIAALVLAIVMTWPLGADLAHLGRTTSADWQVSLWTVNWVARTIVADPLHLYDANIFYPHRTTLAYSEANLVQGLAVSPIYWITRNPFVAYNIFVLLAFASSWICSYLLTRELSGSRPAAAIAAIMFAFCPYVFSHTAHSQLLTTAGVPLSMLMFHRLADAPSPRRGALVGLALAAQALACAYYGIFAGLMVGYAAIFTAAVRRLWPSRAYWSAIAIGAIIAIGVVLPFFIPYLHVQSESGFYRSLTESARWSANIWNYLASPAHAHRSLLALMADKPFRSEILFPGFLAIAFAVLGAVDAGRRRSMDAVERRRWEAAILYGSIGILAFWASFGPGAGLYRVLYYLPTFSFLRAPARFGLIVVFVISVLASFGLASVFRTQSGSRRRVLATVLGLVTAAELTLIPFPWEHAPIPAAPYALLAQLPKGPLAEFPFYGERIAFPLHAQYMMFSTRHWMPMVNGYSDVIPLDFRNAAFVLDSFPSNDAFAILAKYRVRYLTIHWDMFGPRAAEIRTRLEPFARHLRVLASDARMTLYDVVSFP
jgi:hypothetical protein